MYSHAIIRNVGNIVPKEIKLVVFSWEHALKKVVKQYHAGKAQPAIQMLTIVFAVLRENGIQCIVAPSTFADGIPGYGGSRLDIETGFPLQKKELMPWYDDLGAKVLLLSLEGDLHFAEIATCAYYKLEGGFDKGNVLLIDSRGYQINTSSIGHTQSLQKKDEEFEHTLFKILHLIGITRATVTCDIVNLRLGLFAECYLPFCAKFSEYVTREIDQPLFQKQQKALLLFITLIKTTANKPKAAISRVLEALEADIKSKTGFIADDFEIYTRRIICDCLFRKQERMSISVNYAKNIALILSQAELDIIKRLISPTAMPSNADIKNLFTEELDEWELMEVPTEAAGYPAAPPKKPPT
jgi:hypothetical protein